MAEVKVSINGNIRDYTSSTLFVDTNAKQIHLERSHYYLYNY